MNWVTTNIRLPEKEYLDLKMQAAKERKTLSAIIRARLGFKEQDSSEPKGTIALLNLAKKAEEEGWSGPADLSEQHDEYFGEAWDEQKSK